MGSDHYQIGAKLPGLVDNRLFCITFQRQRLDHLFSHATADQSLQSQLDIGAGLIFKGSGFYITDYRSEGYKQAAKKDGGDSGSSAPKAESKPAESKPAPKTESKPAAT